LTEQGFGEQAAVRHDGVTGLRREPPTVRRAPGQPVTRILVDADACPSKHIVREEAGLVPVLWFATVDHQQRDGVEWIAVAKGPDAVDHAIFGATRRGDVVVTQDYGLASLCLGRGARAIHPDGRVYTEETMSFLLEERYTSARLRRAGVRTRGPRPRSAAEDRAFRAALRGVLDAVDGR